MSVPIGGNVHKLRPMIRRLLLDNNYTMAHLFHRIPPSIKTAKYETAFLLKNKMEAEALAYFILIMKGDDSNKSK